uniref:Uncharacterized protein n=1 Tax=Anguilla anguilla TaxID=7936 RepID=A0A0E9SNG5_ANGAN
MLKRDVVKATASVFAFLNVPSLAVGFGLCESIEGLGLGCETPTCPITLV